MNAVLKTVILIAISLACSAAMLIIPYDSIGLTLNPVETRVIALFVFAALMWILEPIPVWATSVLLIQLCLFGISDQSLAPFREERIDKASLVTLIADAAPTASAEQISKIDAASYGKLTKISKLDSDTIRLTLESEFHKAGLHDAAARLYSDELKQETAKIRTVNIVKQRSLLATFADPIIILFLGGFFLAAAATKYKLDVNLANIMMRPFGVKPRNVMLGLMMITAIFAMFMSNTATTAMMLAILAPVLGLFDPNDRGRIGFALCIPVAANIGGIGTPIGTPPNAIAIKVLNDMGLSISFGKWMCLGVPFVIIMLFISWFVLLKLFPIAKEELRIKVKEKFITTPKAIIVYITFVLTISLWIMGRGVHGMDSNTIAFIPIAIFSVTRVITEKDLGLMKWEVLWLVAGGFALGLALQESGLANNLMNAIPFNTWNIIALLLGAGFICMFMSTFMSNTATAALLTPILAAVAGGMIASGVISEGWGIALLVGVAFAASLGMALPISTPPNALAYATGMIKSKDMAISGTILCCIGFVVAITIVTIAAEIGFFN